MPQQPPAPTAKPPVATKPVAPPTPAPTVPEPAPANIATVPSKPLPSALEPLPDVLKERGREGVDFSRDDVLIPRLALAQALSPQVTEGDPAFIEGLKPGDLFNSMTGENYGREVYVQIIRKEPLRAMEFFPQDDGGGVRDPNVPLDDDRLKWGEDGEKPVATLFRDYIARLLPEGEIIALSFKSSGIKVAKALNGLIFYRRGPIYEGKYKITTDQKLVPKPHKIFKVANAGRCDMDDIMAGIAMFDAIKDVDFTETVDRNPHEPEPEDIDFPHVPDEPGAHADEEM